MVMQRMWFGTRGNMQWVDVPDISMDASPVGWGTTSQYLNGGAGVRTSTGSHMEYDMIWSARWLDDLRAIADYADGVYDAMEGINPIYFITPDASNQNVLPKLWATPAQQPIDGLTLFPGQNPGMVSTPPNQYGYPARSATYVSNTSASSLWVPIPPGFTAHIGVHGSAEGDAGVTMATTNGLTASTPVTLTTLPVTTNQRFSDSVDATTGVDGILLSLANNGPVSTDILTWAGTIVQILETGRTPENGGYISGQGHSGCQFETKPAKTVTYVDPSERQGGFGNLSARLIETGSWL